MSFKVFRAFQFLLPILSIVAIAPAARAQPTETTATTIPAENTAGPESTTGTVPQVSEQNQKPGPSQRIEPLDAWVPLAPEEKEVEEKKPKPQHPSLSGIDFEDEDISEDDAKKPIVHIEPPSKPIRLTRAQEQRLKIIKSQRDARARAYRRAFLASQHVDPRGKPEVRLCTLNANNYGIRSEVFRLLKKKQARLLRRKERSIINTVKDVGCDLIALQAIIGREYATAREALDYLTAKLNEATGKEWQSFLGETNHKLAYNAFILNPERIEFIGTKTHTDKLLPRFGEFQEKKFARAPFELIVRVKGQDGSPSRELIVMNLHLQKSLVPLDKEPERIRMQMAEASRQLVDRRQEQIGEDAQPIIMLVGDRVGDRYAPASQILEGRLRLPNFRGAEACRLNEKQEAECPVPARYPELLFGIANGSAPLKVREGKPEKPKIVLKPGVLAPMECGAEPPEEKRLRTTEIYMLQPDLKYAWYGPQTADRYRCGIVTFENGLDHSPVVWVELNW